MRDDVLRGGAKRIAGGRLVDYGKPLSFTFEGRTYEGLAGDTIASALAANGVWLLSRSFKYHRPRGVLTMAGHDGNTLVQVGSEPNVMADRHPISEGLVVRGQNYRGSLARDRDARLGRLARFLPVGFYYRAFYKPSGVWQKFWEPRFRRRAGLGAVDLGAPHGYFDKAFAHTDVAVVGAGPAGLSAALFAAEAGARVFLIDENPGLGGAMNYARLDAESPQGELESAVAGHAGITVMTDAVCTGWFADNWLCVVRGERLYKVRAREVILTTGAIGQPAQFRNNDLPGILVGSAVQRLIRLYGVRPGQAAVVVTANDEGYSVATDLLDAGASVRAVVDVRPEPDGEAGAALRERGVRILNGFAVGEAVPAHGNRHVSGVRVAKVASSGALEGPHETIRCDLLCVCNGHLPAYQLALQAGGRLAYDDARGTFSIEETWDHLHLAGSVNGKRSLAAVIADGRRAGYSAARNLGLDGGAEPEDATDPGADLGQHPIIPHPKGMDFVDFDEDLQVKDILNSVAEGYTEVELVKRFSTVGMGPSQGRHSALPTAQLVAGATGRSIGEVGITTARPPVSAEKLGVLAGRSFEPVRHTAMHHRHLEAGAQMMTAGLWWRPAFYGPRTRRNDAIRDEVLAVRENVSVIDVSTLGGLDIRGPDAAEFMNRIYTFAYVKQQVGRARYVLMTNEAGAIIDDGVACRLAQDHYYVTATTTGVDAVYLMMLWWNAQWRMEVDITNVTSAYAAVNVAGPRARSALEGIVEGVDLSAAAFPYMGVREGTVAGIAARIFRVGFVGELGFELHVPAGQGEALWDAVMEAGKPLGLRPFGVEAQRVLRLEKGHIIVGQDTDALTSPEEADMTWAIAKRKPFFVGKRALELRGRHLSKRKLVGFTLDGDGPLPEESNLVLRDGGIAGFVTSVARSPSLGNIIGLAYTAREEAEPGSAIRIRLSDGRDIDGLVAPHFYDPDNARQEM